MENKILFNEDLVMEENKTYSCFNLKKVITKLKNVSVKYTKL